MTEINKDIGFKAINSGLGLDHFSDGLPYTPEAQSVRTRRSVPPTTAPTAYPPAKTEYVYVEQSSTVEDAPVVETPASLIARGVAFVIDSAIATGIFASVVYAGMRLNSISTTDLYKRLLTRDGAPILGGIAALYLLLTFAYFLIQEMGGRTTLGKSLFKLRISASSSLTVFFRSICFLLSIFPLGFGLLWGFFDSRRRCWHDVITDSRVVRAE